MAGRGRGRGHHQDAGQVTEALTLAKLFDPGEVDWALGHAAVHGRFAEADLASILDHHAGGVRTDQRHQAGEDRSLTQGTSAWARLGQTGVGQPGVGQPGVGEGEVIA